MEAWIARAKEDILAKEIKVVERNQQKIPYTTVYGRFDDKVGSDIYWWTNGFWGGMMWQLYNATGLDIYKSAALFTEEKLDTNLVKFQAMDHDNGFKWLPTSVANYRLFKSEESRNRGLIAAEVLAGRFNPTGNFIRAWNNWDGNEDGSFAGRAIIDCMMNLPLLYWASETICDPRFKQIAMKHADTAARYFIREDGSSRHIIEFNPETGEYLHSLGGQGYEHGSSWTRGQAWAIYGFTLSYMHTKKELYKDTACRVADYFISSIPENGLIPVDFRQPANPPLEDSTASAIAACGFIELSKVTGDSKYMDAALRLLKALYENRCDFTDNQDNILNKCTSAYHDEPGREISIIYGDYYFIEAIFKLTGDELFIW